MSCLRIPLKLSPSFIGISQLLPVTAYVKMIDIWMIFTMLWVFFAVVNLTYKEKLRKRIKRNSVTPVVGIKHRFKTGQ